MSNPGRWLPMTNYMIETSASLLKKADDLDLLALRASKPGHASIYRRVADTSRVAAAFAKITETLDWRDAQAGVGKEPCPMIPPPLPAPA
jgi:hypothetical protein